MKGEIDLDKETGHHEQTRDDVRNFISSHVGKEARATVIWGKGARAKWLHMRRQACTSGPMTGSSRLGHLLIPGHLPDGEREIHLSG